MCNQALQDAVIDGAEVARRDLLSIIAVAQLQHVLRVMAERTGCKGLQPADAGVQGIAEERASGFRLEPSLIAI